MTMDYQNIDTIVALYQWCSGRRTLINDIVSVIVIIVISYFPLLSTFCASQIMPINIHFKIACDYIMHYMYVAPYSVMQVFPKNKCFHYTTVLYR